MRPHNVLIVGAGPAGLATSAELSRAGIDHLVLERGSRAGHTWENLHEGLVLHTGKHFSALPGLAFPASTPLFPARRDFVEYLHRYAGVFRVPVETGVDVVRVDRTDDGWAICPAGGHQARCRALVIATGIVSNPYVPHFPNQPEFRGRVTHSVDYRRPDAFAGRRVLVVGAGNSGAEIALELARAGTRVTIAARSGMRALPRQLFGIPVQYLAVAAALFSRRSARGCHIAPQIGLDLVKAIGAGMIGVKGGLSEFTPATVRFTDGSEAPFEDVILATGYRAAIGLLTHLIRPDACGFAPRHSRVVGRDHPGLYFVGHNYDTQGGLRNIARDARLAAGLIAKTLSRL